MSHKNDVYKECLLYETSYCSTMGHQNCAVCPLNQSSKEAQEEAKRDIDLVRSLLPDGSLGELIHAQTCQLCKHDKEIKPTYYAVIDFGHPEPKSTKTSALGFKVKTAIGSMVPLQIPCCDKCRKNHLISSYMSLAIMVLIVAVGLVVMAIPPITGMMLMANELLPLIVFVLLVPIGWLIGAAISRMYVKKAEEQTIFDVREIPFIQRMTALGWFPITGESKSEMKLIFSKERLKRGWFI